MPVKGTLFDADKGDMKIKLIEEEADKFHHTHTELLYASKQAHIYIALPVSNLCTRVALPTKGDKQKLIRVLEYLKGCTDCQES